MTIKNAIPMLIEYGVYHWTKEQGFYITPTDTARLKSWFDQAEKTGKLVRGRQNPRAWIGFQTVSRLIKKFIEAGHETGTRNWDVTTSQVVSILLVASTLCRSGDLHLSNGYKASSGFYLKWKDVEVRIFGDEPSLSNLSIVISMHHTKGKKGDKNDPVLRSLEPFKDSTINQHVDPCLWILILAMRTGQTKPLLQEVLDDAFKRPGRLLLWNNPDLPVIPMRSKSNISLLLEKPAPTYQVLITIKAMALNARMEGRAYVHALRNGGTRDLSHVRSTTLDGKGFANDTVRQSLGHNAQSKVCTETYAGGHSAATWNLIAEIADYRDHRRPIFTDDHIVPDSTKSSAPDKAFVPPPAPLTKPSTSSHKGGSLRRRKEPRNAAPGDELIDPRLLDLENDELDVHVDDRTMQFVQACTFAGDEDAPYQAAMGADDSLEQEQVMEAIAQEMLDEKMLDDTIEIGITNEDFVSKYAALNIVKNDAWHQQYLKFLDDNIPYDSLASYPTDPAMLCSKDPPTPFVFVCRKTKGCPYTTCVNSLAAQHYALCNEDLVSSRLQQAPGLPCSICGTVLANAITLKKHIKEQHTQVQGWTAKPCEYGCNPKKLYDTPRSYSRHQQDKHIQNRWPAQCTFPGCSEIKNFWNLAGLRRHLVEDHDIAADDERSCQYLPSTGSIRRTWKKIQPCPTIAAVIDETPCLIRIFGSILDMRKHLMTKAHGSLTKEQANSLIETYAEYDIQESKVKIRAVKGKRPSVDAEEQHNDASKKQKKA